MTTPSIKKPQPAQLPSGVHGEYEDGVFYPYSDDEPMAETKRHYIPAAYAVFALENHFADRPDVFVAGDMFIYYAQGQPGAQVAPDVFVVPNVGKHLRNSYFMWREGQAPSFIIEVTSEATYRNDIGHKRDLYESWGVPEYWLYDPMQETLLNPQLQGFRLAAGRYEPITIEIDPNTGRYRGFSAVLNLELHALLDWFRFFNPETGEYLNNLEEAEAGRLAAEAGRQAAEAGRQAAEQALAAEQARLREMGRLLREHGIAPPQ